MFNYGKRNHFNNLDLTISSLWGWQTSCTAPSHEASLITDDHQSLPVYLRSSNM